MAQDGAKTHGDTVLTVTAFRNRMTWAGFVLLRVNSQKLGHPLALQ